MEGRQSSLVAPNKRRQRQRTGGWGGGRGSRRDACCSGVWGRRRRRGRGRAERASCGAACWPAGDAVAAFSAPPPPPQPSSPHPPPPACSAPLRPVQLKRSLEEILAQPGARKPTVARFFRGQMQTIISRALSDVGIKSMPSRRCFTLMSERCNACCWPGAVLCCAARARARYAAPQCCFVAWRVQQRMQGARCGGAHPSRAAYPPHKTGWRAPKPLLDPVFCRAPFVLADWLEDRQDSVYKAHPGYNDKASSLFTIDLGAPEVGGWVAGGQAQGGR